MELDGIVHPPSPVAVEASSVPDSELPEEEPPDELPELEPLPESPAGGFPPPSVTAPPSWLGPVQHSSLAGPGQYPGVET